ncbi:TadE/TadG family type IV pilus assembly protein [Virgibacillus halophilus]|uniref:TadE/TadG family type IV pilus assembly protein n=1 Tax=Tigheibacillus halophilus TaxID=361280 RepID=UPI00362FB8F5
MGRKLKNENGSITLEAALIIPILLTFFLLLISFVKISIAEMALDDAVSDAAQSVAHYSYVAMVVQGVVKKGSDGFVDSLTDKASGKLDNNEVAKYLLKKLGGIGKDAIPTTGDVANRYSDSFYQKMVIDRYKERVSNTSFFNPGGIVVKNSSFPSSTSGDSANVKIPAENTLKIILPFFEKDIKIKKVAVERGWVGN